LRAGSIVFIVTPRSIAREVLIVLRRERFCGQPLPCA
jgi:hypothetical protein